MVAPLAPVAEYAPIPTDKARERAEGSWYRLVLTLMDDIAWSLALFAHPSTVPDSNPQDVQLEPDVQEAGAEFW